MCIKRCVLTSYSELFLCKSLVHLTIQEHQQTGSIEQRQTDNDVITHQVFFWDVSALFQTISNDSQVRKEAITETVQEMDLYLRHNFIMCHNINSDGKHKLNQNEPHRVQKGRKWRSCEPRFDLFVSTLAAFVSEG